MSPSSNLRLPAGARPLAARFLAAALGLLLALLIPASAHAQQQDTYAVLLSGPRPVRDLLMFPPNALVGEAGEYGFRQARVTVLYVRQPLVLPRTWTPRACGSLRLLEVTGQEPYSLCYSDPQGPTLFFSFPAGPQGPELEGPLRCPFVASFVRRFQVLQGLLRDPSEVPFPGVLEVSAP